jgi:3-oxosteroid 1-dehydrogenase
LGADVVSQRQEARLPAALPGVHVPGEEVEGEPMFRALKAGLGAPGTVMVDADGDRFCNEAFWQDFVSRVGQIDVFGGDFAHVPCYLVLDSRHREQYPIAGIEPGRDLSSQVGERADSLAGLAEALGIDPAGLEATVKRFNEHAAEGRDPDFRRGGTPHEEKFRGDPTHEPNGNLAPLEEPPFYGFEVTPVGNGVPSTGLRIDEHARVVDVGGDPITGLYAAGNSAAFTDTGGAYDSGMAMTRGMTYGYIAARHAARN